MKLIIDMPEKAYKYLLKEQHIPTGLDFEYFIIHGTPLPKGHGDLIDSNVLCEQYERTNGDLYQALDLTPTIIKDNNETEYGTSRIDCQSYEETFCESRDCGECECKVEDKE